MGRPATGAAAERVCLVPSPSCPNSFQPQVQTEPSRASTALWFVPAAIATTSGRPGTGAARSRPSGGESSPSWANWLSPHDQTRPSPASARAWCSPAATAVTGGSPSTARGSGRKVRRPSTEPHIQTEPSRSSARPWLPPAAMAAAGPGSLTRRGVEPPASSPSPSWPTAPLPQASTAPSGASARLWLNPAAIASTPASPTTGAGRRPQATTPQV